MKQFWLITRKSLVVIPMFTGFFAHSQLVQNGDFEDLGPTGTIQVAGQNFWQPPSNPVSPSVPQQVYTTGIDLVDGWNSYSSGTQGIDLNIDVRNWGGNYQYDPFANQGGTGPEFINSFSVPDMMGTNQTTGAAMLEDGNPANGQSAYPLLEPNTQLGNQVYAQNNEFLEGRFTQKLDLYKRYTMSFKYSIPCDESSSNGHPTDNITINLFNKELIDAIGNPQDYASDYLDGTATTILDINSTTFNTERSFDASFNDTDIPGSHRLEIHKEQIVSGLTPCKWYTVTFEFCIADLMCDPANNTLQNNFIYQNTPLGYMHNGHMFDVDFYNANASGWPYTYPQTPNITVANWINNGIIPDGRLLYDFKEIFGITLKGTQEVYIDDFSVEEVGCSLDTDFTVTQTCFLDNGIKMVTFQLTPNGPSFNPYIFKQRNVTTGGAFAQIGNSTLPLGGVHTFTVPYVAGEQYEFVNGTWSQGSADCGWTQESKIVTVDPQGDWFATTPDFTTQGLSYSGFPSSWFGILATPITPGLTSTWEYQIEYDNSTLSAWLPVSTSANPTGDGNSQFIVWFDCNDVSFPFLEPDATHSNVKVVYVKRTNYGSCEPNGASQIHAFVHCVQSGEASRSKNASSEVTSITRSELEALIGERIPEEDLMVYPNPATDQVNVQFNERMERSISLTTLSGKEVMTPMETEEMFIQIPMTDLSSGLYFLKVKTNDGLQTKRIVKK